MNTSCRTLMLLMIILTSLSCIRQQKTIENAQPQPTRKINIEASRSVSTNAIFEVSITAKADKQNPMWPIDKVLVSNPPNHFVLKVVNKTNRDIELVWNETLFIRGGQTAGGFMTNGVVYSKRNEPRANDIIFSKSTFEKDIFPNISAVFRSSTYNSGWVNLPLGAGEFGVYLVVADGKNKIKEKIFLTLTVVE